MGVFVSEIKYNIHYAVFKRADRQCLKYSVKSLFSFFILPFNLLFLQEDFRFSLGQG